MVTVYWIIYFRKTQQNVYLKDYSFDTKLSELSRLNFFKENYEKCFYVGNKFRSVSRYKIRYRYRRNEMHKQTGIPLHSVFANKSQYPLLTSQLLKSIPTC